MKIPLLLPFKRMEIILKFATIIIILVLISSGAFLVINLSGYGVPPVYIVKSVGTSVQGTDNIYPVTSTRDNLFASNVIYPAMEVELNAHIEAKNAFGVRLAYLDAHITASLDYEIAISELTNPELLGNWEDIMFLTGEDNNNYYYENVTYNVWAYALKINNRITGSVSVVADEFKEHKPVFGTHITKEDMMKEIMPTMISAFNQHVYVPHSSQTFLIDAPQLNTGDVNPDYVGIMGAWLFDYETKNYVAGTGADCSPQLTGQPFILYQDKNLVNPAWMSSQGAYSPNQLGEQFLYYPEYYAVQYGYFTQSINNLGSTIIYDPSGGYPNYWMWAYEKNNVGDGLPSVAQWVRVDIVTTTIEPFAVPKYQAELPEDWEDIQVPEEPESEGVPIPPPPPPTDWDQIIMVFAVLGFIIVALAVIAVVAGRKKAEQPQPIIIKA